MTKTFLASAFTLTCFANAWALPEVVIGPGLGSGDARYCQSFNRTLDSDTVYVLTGTYFVQPGRTLTIQPGTVIKCATSSVLIIRRDAQIFAQGTQFRPIVFTSRQSPGSRSPGDWKGVIILGRAPTNQINPAVEGGLIEGDCGGGEARYGGTDPGDDSGVFSYVRIEFAGYRFATNNEVNGLSMAGVGSETQIDHVQVSYSDDDSFQWFGGTVSCAYLVAFGSVDDDFNTSIGHRGRIQFCFGLRDPDVSDSPGESHGLVGRNNEFVGTGTETPFTRSIFSNVTLVGPERTNAHVPFPLGELFQFSAFFSQETQTIYSTRS